MRFTRTRTSVVFVFNGNTRLERLLSLNLNVICWEQTISVLTKSAPPTFVDLREKNQFPSYDYNLSLSFDCTRISLCAYLFDVRYDVIRIKGNFILGLCLIIVQSDRTNLCVFNVFGQIAVFVADQGARICHLFFVRSIGCFCVRVNILDFPDI